MYMARATAGSQGNSGSCECMIIAHTNSTKVQFMRSATPFWDGEYGVVIWKRMPCEWHQVHVSRAKPAPSHTQANTCTSPTVPALKPSYSQVTKLGIRACDPEKQHVTGACDRPCDLQVLWGSRDPRAHDPVKKTGDLPRDWSAT